jgi:hypothetical protein
VEVLEAAAEQQLDEAVRTFCWTLTWKREEVQMLPLPLQKLISGLEHA